MSHLLTVQRVQSYLLPTLRLLAKLRDLKVQLIQLLTSS